MTLDTGVVALLVNVVSVAVLLFAGVAKFAKLELKTDNMWGAFPELTQRVNTLWDFQFRRGAAELVHKGWASMQSPIKLRVESFEKVQPFLTQFIPAYVRWVASKPDITDSELAERFEREFGDFILEHLCIPEGLTQGACLTALVLACRTEPVELAAGA